MNVVIDDGSKEIPHRGDYDIMITDSAKCVIYIFTSGSVIHNCYRSDNITGLEEKCQV